MVSLRYIIDKEKIIMESILNTALGIGTAYIAILFPVLIIFVILYFGNKNKKEKFNAMIEISKNLQDPSEIKELLEDFKEKKQPIDYRRSGVLTLFVGIGLFLLGFALPFNLIKGVGLLIGAIGVGSIIAGYLYPNESAEITKAVENFEKK